MELSSGEAGAGEPFRVPASVTEEQSLLHRAKPVCPLIAAGEHKIPQETASQVRRVQAEQLTSPCPVSEPASAGGGGDAGDVSVNPCW